MITTNTVLDLFSGLGGWSDGFAKEGFQVLGVEIEPEIARLYKHPCVVADVRTLDGARFRDFDVIVGSPPCRDFTQLPDHAVFRNGTIFKWKKPKNPKEGLVNVHAFLDFVKDAEPEFWLMENVPNLRYHLKLEPKCRSKLTRGMQRCFWGNFPAFLVPQDMRIKNKDQHQGKLRSWKRARIPFPVASAFAHACKEALQ